MAGNYARGQFSYKEEREREDQANKMPELTPAAPTEGSYVFGREIPASEDIPVKREAPKRFSPIVVSRMKAGEIQIVENTRSFDRKPHKNRFFSRVVPKEKPAPKPKPAAISKPEHTVTRTEERKEAAKVRQAPPSTVATHGIGTIQSTTMYKVFKKLKVNRVIDKRHVNKLVTAIRKKNLLHLNPIVVDADMNIIDGQHRLEAAKLLKTTIYYTKDDTVNQDDISGMNSNKKNWGAEDYINFHAENGVSEFVTFKEFQSQYPNYKSSLLLSLVSSTGKRNSAGLREGKLDIGNLEKAEQLIGYISDFKQYTDLADNTRFVEAIALMALDPGYDHERMLRKVSENPTAIVPCPNKKGFVLMLQQMFNKGLSEKNLVYFIKR